jgi:hypothetical protein
VKLEFWCLVDALLLSLVHFLLVVLIYMFFLSFNGTSPMGETWITQVGKFVTMLYLGLLVTGVMANVSRQPRWPKRLEKLGFGVLQLMATGFGGLPLWVEAGIFIFLNMNRDHIQPFKWPQQQEKPLFQVWFGAKGGIKKFRY